VEVPVSSHFTPPSTWRPARGGPVATRIPVEDLSRVGEARRAADVVARSCGLDEERRGVVGIVVTEAATNLARHAQGGYILLRDTAPNGHAGVEMLAVDRGPGMHDLARSFADGYSTGGTLGHGLGAMRRQANVFDVYSQPGPGTVVLARVFAETEAELASKPRHALLDVGVVCEPIEGETACGDGWCVVQQADRAMVLLVDGLGHGPNAAQAADVAIERFREVADRRPAEAVAALHEALRATRGAALAVAEVTRAGAGASVTFCAVGNTVSAIVGMNKSRSLASMNGTAGLNVGKLQEFSQQWDPGAMMIMHTDGLTTRWRIENQPSLLARDPAIVAAVLHRDYQRPRDDSTVLAVSLRPREGP
jgi:anti-sigma regulatory factor (Ser/Thr protein kinase)